MAIPPMENTRPLAWAPLVMELYSPISAMHTGIRVEEKMPRNWNTHIKTIKATAWGPVKSRPNTEMADRAVVYTKVDRLPIFFARGCTNRAPKKEMA